MCNYDARSKHVVTCIRKICGLNFCFEWPVATWRLKIKVYKWKMRMTIGCTNCYYWTNLYCTDFFFWPLHCASIFFLLLFMLSSSNFFTVTVYPVTTFTFILPPTCHLHLSPSLSFFSIFSPTSSSSFLLLSSSPLPFSFCPSPASLPLFFYSSSSVGFFSSFHGLELVSFCF